MNSFRIAPLEFDCNISKKEEGVYCLSIGDIGCFEDDKGEYKLSEYYDDEGTVGFDILLNHDEVIDIRNIYNSYLNSCKERPFKDRRIEVDNGYVELKAQYGGLHIEVGKTDSNGVTIATGIEVDSETGAISNIKYIKNVVNLLDELIDSK